MEIFTRNKLLLISAIVFQLVFLYGCEPKDDEDLVPSYIHIENIDLNTVYQQGTSSSKISDAWIYIDGAFIGSFELPATVPILTSGKKTINIRPGIKLNGISNTRSVYPFFTALNKEVELVKDSVVNISGTTVNYATNAKFPWLESFENSSLSLDTTSKSTVGISKTSDPALVFPEMGNSYSAIVQLAADTAIFEAVTTEKFDFPGNGNSIFLEMNYKINQEMVVGVFYVSKGLRVQRPLIVLNRSDEWNKVYINLSVPKYDTPSATDFQIFFGAQKNSGNTDAIFLLDNLKLVHF